MIKKSETFAFFSGFAFTLLMFQLMMSSDVKIEKETMEKEILDFNKTISLKMSLAEQIHAEQYSCAIIDDDGPKSYDEQAKCRQIEEISISQDKDGNYYLGEIEFPQ